jgi:hypothetical protein
MLFGRVVENLQEIESRLDHKRTIVLGDFNANPFDSIVGSVDGLHAINMKEVNGRKSRDVLQRSYEFFYNPMWACYGSEGAGPKASYYFYTYEGHELFWHMLDQVVLRPDVIEMFNEGRLRILTAAGGIDLLTERGLPNHKLASDHLPVMFELNV